MHASKLVGVAVTCVLGSLVPLSMVTPVEAATVLYATGAGTGPNANVGGLYTLDPQTGVERVSVRSAGALRVAGYLGGPWELALAFGVMPRFLRDWVYNVIARFRYRVFGRYETCPVPSDEQRPRFIDAT